MVECHAIGDATAPIVTDDREALEPQPCHQLDELSGHLALAVPLAQRTAGCRSAIAIALEVADHDRVAFRQPRSDGVPAIVSLRKAVQKQDGRAIAGDPRPVGRGPFGDGRVIEAVDAGVAGFRHGAQTTTVPGPPGCPGLVRG